jgi:phage repressor protein C with HTH and peptisase S24 domain
LFVKTPTDSFVVDTSVKQISNGFWLVDIDGVKACQNLRIPVTGLWFIKMKHLLSAQWMILKSSAAQSKSSRAFNV